MLDKYFGFLKIHDEDSVVESFIEHTRIDDEEILLLQKMIELLCENKSDEVRDYYMKIRSISSDSERVFENIADQIINADFDHQKQYDLLRIYQRIEGISGLIMASAKRILILTKINGTLPEECHPVFRDFMKGLLNIHDLFKDALNQYLNDKNSSLKSSQK